MKSVCLQGNWYRGIGDFAPKAAGSALVPVVLYMAILNNDGELSVMYGHDCKLPPRLHL